MYNYYKVGEITVGSLEIARAFNEEIIEVTVEWDEETATQKVTEKVVK